MEVNSSHVVTIRLELWFVLTHSLTPQSFFHLMGSSHHITNEITEAPNIFNLVMKKAEARHESGVFLGGTHPDKYLMGS